MNNKQRTGAILILVGIGLFIISFAFIKGYDKQDGLLGSLGQMEFVLREGDMPKPEAPRPAEAPAPPSSEKQDVVILPDKEIKVISDFIPVEKEDTKKTHIAIPYKYFFTIDIAIIFVGIAFLILPKKNLK